MKKGITLAASILAVLLISVSMNAGVVAQAQTFQFHQPSFGLYCENENAIQEGRVNFNLTGFEPTKLEATSHSTYKIKTEVGKTESFSIPFLGRVYEVPEFKVTANGKAVEGHVSYGESHFDYTEIDLKEAMQSVVSPTIPEGAGIYYSIEPTAETVELTMERESGQRFIQGFGSSRSSHYASGKDIFTIDTKEEGKYHLFIIGEEATVSAVGAELKQEAMTCKEYIDGFYDEFKEYYDEMGGIPVEFFYSEFTRMNGREQTHEHLFFNSFANYRLMSYDFSVVAEAANFEIEFDQSSLYIMANARFSPSIYMLEQRTGGSYPTTYTFGLKEEFPFLLESSSKAQKSENQYSVSEQGKDFYFVFCSVAKPTDLYPTEGGNGGWAAWQIACFCIAGVGTVALGFCIAMLIRTHIKAKKEKLG